MGATRITEDEYKTIKLLSKQTRMTQEEIGRCVRRGVSVIGAILSTDTFDEYLEKRYENSRKYNAKRYQDSKTEKAQETPAPQVVNPTVVRIEATHYMMQKLEETNNLLKLISNKLAYIVDDLYGTGKKEG
jgi:hypothetical protein